MNNTPSQSFWESTASVLIQQHGTQTVEYCVRRAHALIEQGNKSEALVWIEIAFTSADFLAQLGLKGAITESVAGSLSGQSSPRDPFPRNAPWLGQ